MGAHEIHRAEVEADDARQRGDRPRVVHGAVRLDHHADRDLAAESAPRGFEREALEEALDVADRFRLGRGQERDAVAGVAEQNRELLDRARVVDVVDPRSDAIEAVGGAGDDRGHLARVLELGADGRAVLAIGGNVEVAAALGLQRERLVDELRTPRVVHARGQRGQRPFAAPERRLR